MDLNYIYKKPNNLLSNYRWISIIFIKTPIIDYQIIDGFQLYL